MNGAAAAAAAIAEAVKASGVIVRLDPENFLRVLERQERPLVVHATGGLIRTNYQYLFGYKGLAFYTKSPTPLSMPGTTDIVAAKSIWVPG